MIDLFCVASGPSLVKEDCELLRRSSVKIVAVNNSWQMVPFCDYVYAGDAKWWKAYRSEVKTERAEFWTCSVGASARYGLKLHQGRVGAYNSGMRAIEFAIHKGFKRIGLLGYDCSIRKGLHWHGAHKFEAAGNPDELRLLKWKKQFDHLAARAEMSGVKIFNCSRETELDCFERISLEEVLSCVA